MPLNSALFQCISIAVVILGFAVTHLLAKKRDSDNLKITRLLEYRMDAYFELVKAANSSARDESAHRAIESAIDRVILLGNEAEVAAAKKFGNDIASNPRATLNELIQILGKRLRKDLKLAEFAGAHDFYQLRFTSELMSKS